MKPYNIAFALVLLAGITGNLIAQEALLEQVKAEIQAVTEKEEQAFKVGDCETLMSLMADNITFYANGRPSPPRNRIRDFCENIPRPFADLASANLTVNPLSAHAGYVVRTRAFDKNEQIRVHEIVTKIWNRIDGEWKMVHLHSTVQENPKKE